MYLLIFYFTNWSSTAFIFIKHCAFSVKKQNLCHTDKGFSAAIGCPATYPYLSKIYSIGLQIILSIFVFIILLETSGRITIAVSAPLPVPPTATTGSPHIT